MAEVAVHAPGTPIWVDLSTPDPSAASAFYAKLFSWTRTEPSAEAGGYAMFQLEGRIVAGVGPQQQAGAPPFWMTYVSTEDAAATAARVEASGGKTIAPPMEVLGEGSMAVFSDPSGAVFGVWQPARFKGAEIYNQPGAYTWSELQVRGIDAAKPFYGAVFGWDAHVNPGEVPYTEWMLNGRSIGGGMDMNDIPDFPSNVPPNWLVYFSVADCAAGVSAAREAGGQVLAEPRDTPQGPFAVLSDPQGAVFAIISPPKG